MTAQVGLDIGSSTIKVARVNGNKVDKIGMAANPLGKLNLTADVEVVKMAEAIKKLYTDLEIGEKEVRVVIPDSVTYARVILMPVLTQAELASAIQWEAEQYIPISLEEVELTFDVLYRPAKHTGQEKMSVLLLASPKKIISGLVNVFARVGLEPVNIESEVIATSRILMVNKTIAGSSMLCTMGSTALSIALFKNEMLTFIYRLNSGGMAMTRAISAALQLSLLQAEEYKRSYGVESNVLEGRLLLAMNPVLEGIVTEMKRSHSYFNQMFPGDKVERVVLTGGGALMPGLVHFLTDRTGIEAVIGNPFVSLSVDEANKKIGPVYAGVLGTAI